MGHFAAGVTLPGENRPIRNNAGLNIVGALRSAITSVRPMLLNRSTIQVGGPTRRATRTKTEPRGVIEINSATVLASSSLQSLRLANLVVMKYSLATGPRFSCHRPLARGTSISLWRAALRATKFIPGEFPSGVIARRWARARYAVGLEIQLMTITNAGPWGLM